MENKKITIQDLIAFLPLRVKTERNVFNLKMTYLGKNTYRMRYENFFKISSQVDKNMTQEFIISEDTLIPNAKNLCELLITSKAIEIGKDMKFLGNINIVRAYKALQELERMM